MSAAMARPTICPHPSYHNVCDACVSEYHTRAVATEGD